MDFIVKLKKKKSKFKFNISSDSFVFKILLKSTVFRDYDFNVFFLLVLKITEQPETKRIDRILAKRKRDSKYYQKKYFSLCLIFSVLFIYVLLRFRKEMNCFIAETYYGTNVFGDTFRRSSLT